VVRAVAERLRKNGLKVWFDEWELKPGDSIPAKIEEGLEHSRVLVLCMSANAFGSDWAQLEAGTFRFRDPLSKERRFVPLRLDDAPIKGSLAQFLYINWLPAEQEYAELVEACHPPAKPAAETQVELVHFAEKAIQLDYKANIDAYEFSLDGKRVLTGADDKTVQLWDLEMGCSLRVLEGHADEVCSVAWSTDQRCALSGAWDNTVRLWDVETGRCLRVFKGHTGGVNSVLWSNDQRHAVSGSDDQTVRFWDVETGRCLRVLAGHTARVWGMVWSSAQRHVLSCSEDTTVRLWDVETGLCVRVLAGHTEQVVSVAWCADRRRAFSGDVNGGIRVWDLTEFVTEARAPEIPLPALPPTPDQIQYTNAKVLLVGDTSAGKTGLSKRLALNDWQPNDSTVGAWATQWKLPVTSGEGVEREIWLWDFGGQADQRLIHQLYMDETALAVLVFDGQKEDLFETLGQWDRDLTRASRKEFAKLLVAGRVDAGGLRVSRSDLEKFAKERKFLRFLETSAKTNLACEELKQAILEGINWDDIPCRTTEVLFNRLKEEIIRLKDAGRVLMRFNQLRETLQLRLSGEFTRFTDEELRAVLTLLAGPGVVWELKFGSWVLLQPERINAYAQAVIQTLRKDEFQRGCLMEERVLKGDLAYESSMARLEGDEERFVLLAMHQTLVERGLCIRQPTDKGNLLIFPSYYRRERPEQVSFPAVLVSYRFTGFLDEIYATLVVRLHHTEPFQQDHLWRYAADFKTNLGRQLGVKLTRRAPGMGELEVYFDPVISMEEKIIFSKYVHEHLLQHARDVERLRHYVCRNCGTPVGNREVAMNRLNAWLQARPPEPDVAGWAKFHRAKEETPSIICVGCEERVPLWDELEQCFASPEIQQRVRDMQEESAIVLDNESKERALVGEVISTVTLAAQICREFNVSDHGIDMEIEFKDDNHEVTGEKLYLQLKSGDSYLRERKSDGAEIFTIKDEHHARYWMAQKFPVLLVIRTSEGEVRWMEVRNWLRRTTDNGKKPVKQIVFKGERFDVMSVRRWREIALSARSI
jgi:small GTP-binding protein